MTNDPELPEDRGGKEKQLYEAHWYGSSDQYFDQARSRKRYAIWTENLVVSREEFLTGKKPVITIPR